jgi:hypothetical protein
MCTKITFPPDNKKQQQNIQLMVLNLKVWWPYATLFVYFIFLLQYIHSYNHSLITFVEALLHVFIAAGSVGGTSLGCRAEIRTRACLTASQRTTNWAALLMVLNETGCRAWKIYISVLEKWALCLFLCRVCLCMRGMHVCMCSMAQMKNVCSICTVHCTVQCTCVVRIIYMAGKETH